VARRSGDELTTEGRDMIPTMGKGQGRPKNGIEMRGPVWGEEGRYGRGAGEGVKGGRWAG